MIHFAPDCADALAPDINDDAVLPPVPLLVVAVLLFPSASPLPGPQTQARSFEALELDVLDELNRLRADPRGYAEQLKPMVEWYDATLLRRPGGLPPIRTAEGAPAVIEAIAALEQQARPSLPLTSSPWLAAAAADHARDQGASGAIGHQGSDGSNSRRRMSRYGVCAGVAGEVIDYGWRNAHDIVIDLLIDDGVKDRGHRLNILDQTYELAGVACGPHKFYGVVCVVDMAERYTPLPPVDLAHPP